METTVEDLQWDIEKLRTREQKLNKHLAEAMEQVREIEIVYIFQLQLYYLDVIHRLWKSANVTFKYLELELYYKTLRELAYCMCYCDDRL